MYHSFNSLEWRDDTRLTILSVLTLIAVVDVYRTFYHGAKS
jgi:hypothetical protein